MSETYSESLLLSGKAIFLNYWNVDNNSIYEKSVSPGFEENVFSSYVRDINIALSKYANEESINGATMIIKFLTSKEIQKQIIINYHIYSELLSLYDDEEVCSVVNCDYYKNLQPITIPPIQNYGNFSHYVKENFNKYLNGELMADELLNEFTLNSYNI